MRCEDGVPSETERKNKKLFFIFKIFVPPSPGKCVVYQTVAGFGANHAEQKLRNVLSTHCRTTNDGDSRLRGIKSTRGIRAV